ncbi:MAG: hypothetical protein ABII00_00855 [Elusimicrobiota bacterium]
MGRLCYTKQVKSLFLRPRLGALPRRAAGALAASALLLGAVRGPALAGVRDWNETLSPHFVVLHESAFAPSGVVLDLEKLHNRLRLDLSMFAPWMAKERVKIYLYKTRESYLHGKFQPPSWSTGIAVQEEKLIATFEFPSREEFLDVIGHELTHLLFEGYWAEVKKTPPVWLNEGLSMIEESPDRSRPEKSRWYQAMAFLTDRTVIPLSRYVRMNPGRDLGSNKDAVTLWYVQAYSLVHFLYRRHTRLQFFNFCGLLRDGTRLERALWKVYRYQSLERLEAAWKRWLKLPDVRNKFLPQERAPAISARAEAPDRGRKKSMNRVRFRTFHYRSLIPDE